ncbi:hypothetical protein C8F01DRAFT_1225955 [Mycena amicta]|nr:hypothetical protein C8F01DRAFT_1225955 [Mycena amicta]
MPPAHCIQTLLLNLKLLIRLVQRYSLATYNSFIIAWVRRLWRCASYKPPEPDSDEELELAGGKWRNRAPQTVVHHHQPAALAHDSDMDDHKENQSEHTPSIDATQTASPPGPMPSILPPSFPSYLSSALSPTAPELLAQKRGQITKSDNTVTLDPLTRSFRRNDPTGWVEHIHPEGALYYAHDSMNIFTRSPMHENATFKDVQRIVNEIQMFHSANGTLLDPHVDLVLQVTSNGQGCEYYLVDHKKRIIFWHHAFEMERLPRCYEVYGPHSPNHIRIPTETELTAQYWFHCACFPDNRPVTSELVRELRDIVLYSIIDSQLDPQAVTLPHSVDDLLKMLTVIESLKEKNDTPYNGVVICDKALLDIWFSHPSQVVLDILIFMATQNRRTSVFGYLPKRSLLLRILTPILFNTPNGYLQTLEEVYVDEILNLTSWCRVVDTLSLEWQEHILFATVLMNASIAFLTIPTVDNGQNTFTRSTGQVAGYISVIASLGSIFVGLILLHRNRTRKDDIDAMASFFGSHFHSYLGLEPLALLYSLPFALLMWGTIAFMVAFLAMCLRSSDASTRAIVTCSTVVVMFSILSHVTASSKRRNIFGSHRNLLKMGSIYVKFSLAGPAGGLMADQIAIYGHKSVDVIKTPNCQVRRRFRMSRVTHRPILRNFFAIVDELEAQPQMVLESDCPQGSELTAYYKAVKSKPLSSERAVISSCRASGLRRQEFATFIFDGNTKNLWKTGDNGKLPILQLLRDCETRWSAIHLMNVRFLLLFEPISGFLKHPNQSSIAKHQLDDDQHQVLLDMQTILSVPHAGQELLSAERTPTLSIALPAYELILDSWLKLQNEIPELKHYIGVGIAKIQEYIKLGRKSRIYLHVTVINPSMKLDWIEKHWPARDVRKAEEWI